MYYCSDTHAVNVQKKNLILDPRVAEKFVFQVTTKIPIYLTESDNNISLLITLVSFCFSRHIFPIITVDDPTHVLPALFPCIYITSFLPYSRIFLYRFNEEIHVKHIYINGAKRNYRTAEPTCKTTDF